MSVFHQGELEVQQIVGVKESVALPGQRMIRESMPDQHREFFQNQSMIFMGLVDVDGYPWATPVFGPPGFIRSPDPNTLMIDALPLLQESGQVEIKLGDKVGLLGIELNTRRRNRLNGGVGQIYENGFSVDVEQSFGNCPKYIQKREFKQKLDDVNSVSSFESISIDNPHYATVIENADTFFIASRSASLTKGTNAGVDVSHRGGKPGFVKQIDGDSLIFPDFSGNHFFNTLGNIVSDSRVGLFIPDFSTGQAIWLNGEASIIWDPNNFAEFEGAERFIKIKVDKILLKHIAVMQSLSDVELSPKLEQTGAW